MVVGLVPALSGSAARLSESLKQGGRSATDSVAAGRMRRFLVVAEIGLSLILLVGAGLMLRSLLELNRVDPGFEGDDVLTARISLPRSQYDDRTQWIPRFREFEKEVSAIPGVLSAGFIHDIPLGGDRQGTSVEIEGVVPDPEANRQVNFSFVTPGYLTSMGIPLRTGRHLQESDTRDSEAVLVVNESLARRFLSDRDPLATRLLVGFSSQTPRRIVGVVGDVRHDAVDVEPTPTVYVPYYQVPWSRGMTLAVRTDADSAAVFGAVRARLRALEPAAPIFDVRSMDQIVAQSVSQPRFSTLLLGAFAGLALLLAAIGIYGVISFSVAQRTQDIGVRVALGARRIDIMRLILGEGMLLTAIGIGIGLAGAFALTEVIGSMLYGVAGTDPTTFVGIPILLAVVALAAAWFPARRATRVDPLTALRHD